MTKICIITSVHYPFDVRIYQKQARSLVKAGYDVTIIAQHEKEEIIEGIKIVNLQRSRNRIERITKIVWSAYRKALVIDADIYHFHDPELIPVGLRLRRLGKKVIFDIHEDTRKQIKLKKYLPWFLRYFLSGLYGLYEDYACRSFSAIVTPQNKMSLHYRNINKTVTIENYVDISMYPDREPDFKQPVLFHPGILSVDKGLLNMINVAKKIEGEFIFYVAGKLDEGLRKSSISPLIYLGELNQTDIGEVYRKSNIGIILHNNVGQYSMAGALKCYEYMANSMPIIMPNFGEWVEFNERNKCGINVNVYDSVGIAETIYYLIKNKREARQLGKNGRNAVMGKYNWEIGEKKLLELYDEMLNK